MQEALIHHKRHADLIFSEELLINLGPCDQDRRVWVLADRQVEAGDEAHAQACDLFFAARNAQRRRADNAPSHGRNDLLREYFFEAKLLCYTYIYTYSFDRWSG